MALEPVTFTAVDGGVVAPAGFTCAGVQCGLKKNASLDLALVVGTHSTAAAAVFTTNRVGAAPVELSRRHVADGHARAVVINAGYANACTGARGRTDAEAMAAAVAAELGCVAEDVLVCSTGVIGVPLPLERVLGGIAAAGADLDDRSGDGAAAAIMTTDTFAKQSAVSFVVDGRSISVGGMAKGSGMIKPNMATMLAVVTTDAPLTAAACDAALRAACATTFNRVSVDGDTSTNDTAILMASGAAGGDPITADDPAFAPVAEAVRIVCADLARMIARDGEGATKLVDVVVTGAVTVADAELAAFAIADSPLVKTALFGADANWGRVAMALGKSGAALDPDALSIRFAGIEVCRDGTAVPFDEDAARAALEREDVTISADLGVGASEASVVTCDLSYEYVRINGAYRS